MKLITLNTWGKCGPFKERWNFFLEESAALKPDVLCLQEVMDDELTCLLEKFLGFSNVASAYSAGLLMISRFPLYETSALTYRHHSSLERADERRAIIAKMKIDGKELVIANTHLAWRNQDKPIRNQQVQELLEAMKKMNAPSIVCGDLNDVPESSALEQIKTAGYENLIQDFDSNVVTWDNQNPYIQSHKEKFPDRQIDYILTHQSVSKILKPKTCQVVFNRANEKQIYPSDHYGIFANFQKI